jgi:hypothetical protein
VIAKKAELPNQTRLLQLAENTKAISAECELKAQRARSNISMARLSAGWRALSQAESRQAA